MTICEFTSKLALLDSATHYRTSQKDGQGPVSKIIKRARCPVCGRTVMLRTANGTNATFTTRHPVCVRLILEDIPDDEC